MPVIVEGFRHSSVPLLWKDGVWQDQQLRGGDGYQVEPDGRGAYRFVFVYPIRTGQQHAFTVTRAQCSTGIARMRDSNGDVQLDAPSEGTFTLKAPALFAPGTNVVKAGEAIVAFTGHAQSVRSIPLSARAREGSAEVEVVSYEPGSIRLKTRGGPLELSLHDAGRGDAFSAQVNGQRQALSARSGRVLLTIDAREAEVMIERALR
jgi:hypothetical protein